MLTNFYVMKRNLNIFLFTIFYLLGSTGFSQVDVTFKVDMQYQSVSESGVYIAAQCRIGTQVQLRYLMMMEMEYGK